MCISQTQAVPENSTSAKGPQEFRRKKKHLPNMVEFGYVVPPSEWLVSSFIKETWKEMANLVLVRLVSPETDCSTLYIMSTVVNHTMVAYSGANSSAKPESAFAAPPETRAAPPPLFSLSFETRPCQLVVFLDGVFV